MPAVSSFELPENHKYKIEVIDVWEMTRTTLIEETSGETRCMLPGKEGIAVVATLIEEEENDQKKYAWEPSQNN